MESPHHTRPTHITQLDPHSRCLSPSTRPHAAFPFHCCPWSAQPLRHQSTQTFPSDTRGANHIEIGSIMRRLNRFDGVAQTIVAQARAVCAGQSYC